MNVIAFNEIESSIAANDQVDSICIELTTFNQDNVISFESKKKNKEILDAFLK
ncbi:hypothetical protein BANRA_03788 [Escherichia coli]|uniref:hypothetical protein n=1 Tax=Escherichia coli TaxID=562 RepID=UPI000F1007C1|nr:hypothetical protein [Escherichia coli]VDA92266.1 hypothetical protein BANRA_03788 [Escherichia coli]